MYFKIRTIVKSTFIRIKYFPRLNCAYLRCSGNIIFGKNVYIAPGGIIDVQHGACLIIGPNTYIGEYCNIRVDKTITIGENCKIAQFVTIVDADYIFAGKYIDHKSRNISPVSIGNNVFIGVGSSILRGSYIANNSIIPSMSKIMRISKK